MRILIVEDDFVCRTTLMALLKDQGQCEAAVDGEEGVTKILAAYDNGTPFDLVCLDINMPRMDGQEALQAIRKFEDSKGIFPGKGVKVLMTTALDDKGNIFKAFRGLVDGYLVKPIRKQHLIQQIRLLGFDGNDD